MNVSSVTVSKRNRAILVEFAATVCREAHVCDEVLIKNSAIGAQTRTFELASYSRNRFASVFDVIEVFVEGLFDHRERKQRHSE